MTNKYEAAIVLSVAQGEDATAALKEKFNDLIAKHGTIENVDDWGKRRLAYLINDERKATMFSSLLKASRLSRQSLSV